MIHLITGGSGSGKSAFAEEQILKFGDGKRIYIATMHPYDQESFARIDRHRAMRSKKKFETIECYTNLKQIQIPPNANVLLECMSNLTANEIFEPSGAGFANAKEEILRGISTLMDCSENLVIVTNEIFSDGYTYDKETREYQEILGSINVQIAAWADCVTEVVYGIPLTIKSYV
ncbi:MAG: bifunctional adenosylcobinamide kinase/adenosylcobinamide-phosphate guanylyltransferase [Fusicatenibacter sp.]|nr:bifunctional adenosylcobinamide kinase/adenosylcobinamide-phosphate guanylyltransferase [Lachnospiraceae bacterium]MDY2937481.1 bifunctional adenosylcobinamide kinase/adenosylcobinamide-phosphate guanylyltransferase [Fusicatenibacter sp.]